MDPCPCRWAFKIQSKIRIFLYLSNNSKIIIDNVSYFEMSKQKLVKIKNNDKINGGETIVV